MRFKKYWRVLRSKPESRPSSALGICERLNTGKTPRATVKKHLDHLIRPLLPYHHLKLVPRPHRRRRNGPKRRSTLGKIPRILRWAIISLSSSYIYSLTRRKGDKGQGRKTSRPVSLPTLWARPVGRSRTDKVMEGDLLLCVYYRLSLSPVKTLIVRRKKVTGCPISLSSSKP